MGRAPHATTPADDDLAVAEAMARAEVTAFALRPFSALSGGERARVAFARVLARRAPLPLFEEPTAALDLRHQELVLRPCRVPRGTYSSRRCFRTSMTSQSWCSRICARGRSR
jgi:iron complex transport system ATP-binding protein